MRVRIDSIRACFEGMVPAAMATASPDGTPNLAYLSQVQYVDNEHVALTYQFFNKTRRNILANPHAMLMLVDPRTAAQYRLSLEYLRTETSGPLFESMKAKLAGIASHTGMSGVFRLLGADVFKVRDIQQVPGDALPAGHPAAGRGMEGGHPTAYICQTGQCSQPITNAADLAAALTLPPQLRAQQQQARASA